MSTCRTAASMYALAHEHVPDRRVDVRPLRVARLDHVAVRELHGLGALRPQFSRDDDLDAFCTRLHHESNNTVARPPHREATEQLVFQRLGLGLGTQAPVRDALRIEFNSSVLEVEALLDHAREFSNSLALLAEDILRSSGADDDLRP